MTHPIDGHPLVANVRALLDERQACVKRIAEIDAIVGEIRAALGIPADLVELAPPAAASALTHAMHVGALERHRDEDRAVPPARPPVVNADLSINEDQLTMTERQIVQCVQRHHPKTVRPGQIGTETVVPYTTVNDRLPNLLRLGVIERAGFGKYKLGGMKVNWTSSGAASKTASGSASV